MTNIDKIREIVNRGYREILKRDPDPEGINHYLEELSSGRMISERFYDTLRNSDEFKNMGNRTYSGSEKITYCMIGGNKLHEIKEYIPYVLPYVDRFIYIDSGSTDGTIEFLQGQSTMNNDKITIVTKSWEDKFSAFRNHYLDHLRSEGYDGWVIVSDTDEYYPSETLSQLKNLIKESNNGISYNGILFRSYDVFIDDNNRSKIKDQYLSNYWKGLMFKFHPNIRYEGEPHETLVGIPINWRQTDYIYRHIRSSRKIYLRAVENFFISNSNRYSAKWKEFREICNRNNMHKFYQFIERFNRGDLPKEIEDWIWNHRDDNENDGDSEVREQAKLYFEILFPGKR